MKRTKEEASRTREEILNAGLRVFSEKGYAAATLSHVARAAGVTRGAIYWHFKCKNALFSELVARLDSFYDEILHAAFQSTASTTDMLWQVIVQILDRFSSDPEWRAMQEIVLRTSFLQRDNGDLPFPIENAEERAAGILQRAIERNEIFDGWDGRTAAIAISAYVGGLLFQLMRSEHTPTRERIEALADFAVRGLQPEGAKR